jgi:hypothetical protein
MLALLPAVIAAATLALPRVEPAWTAHVDPSNQVYPSMVIALATAKSEKPDQDELDARTDEEVKRDEAVEEQTLGDSEGWVYITVKNPAQGTKVRVTVECPDVMDASTFKGVMEKEGATYGVAPKIRWKYKDLARVRQPIPVNVVFKVKLGDGEEDEDVRVCTLHTINDCPYLHLEKHEGEDLVTARNLGFMFAAYVNEDHPWVDGLLKKALESRTVENFTGYQAGTEEEVFRQVYAVWNVLQQGGITYSDITKTSTRLDTVPSQHVRFLDESIGMKQANCVDGSVLVASVLRKIGLDVFLFVTPNHCYVGFFTDKDRQQMAGLETTVLGQAKKEDFDRTAKLRALLIERPKSFDEASFDSFQAALAVGTKNLEEHAEKMKAGEFQYLQVIIKDCREQGIHPIPYFPPEAAPKPAEPKAAGDARDPGLLDGLRIKGVAPAR